MSQNTFSIEQFIKYLFEDFAIRSKMLNDFGFGAQMNLNAWETALTPFLWVDLKGADYGSGLNGYLVNSPTFTLYIMDRLEIDIDNEKKVLSDTKYILDQLITYLDQHVYLNELEIKVEKVGTAEPIREGKLDSNTIGWMIDITLSQPLRINPCNSPVEPIQGYTISFCNNISEYRMFGATGPQGATGSQGEVGPTGPQGATGATGDFNLLGLTANGIGSIGASNGIWKISESGAITYGYTDPDNNTEYSYTLNNSGLSGNRVDDGITPNQYHIGPDGLNIGNGALTVGISGNLTGADITATGTFYGNSFFNQNDNSQLASQVWVGNQGYLTASSIANVEYITNKNQPLGYAGLDINALIPTSLLPDSVLGNNKFKGTFDPLTTTFSATPSNMGWYYISIGVGTYSGLGFNIGDWMISEGTFLSKVDNTDAVMSVNGRLGNVVIISSDITNALGYTPSSGAGITGPAGATGAGGALGYYGNFYDTTNQTALSATTSYVVGINTMDIHNGVNNDGGTRIIFDNSGTYNIQFSLQLSNTSAQVYNTNVWIRKNGVDVPYTTGQISVPNKHGSVNGGIIASWNYILNISANDYIQLVWQVENSAVSLQTIAAGTNPTTPIAPSVILTAQQVMYSQVGPTGPAFSYSGTGIVYSTGGTISYLSGNNTQFVKADGTLDSSIYITSATLSNYLPLTGGTISGGISVQGITVGRGNSAVASNLAVGSGALAVITSGASNVGIGLNALNADLTGSFNTAVGNSTLSKSTASSNSAFGYSALFNNTTGNLNVALGGQSLLNNITGASNVAVGNNALFAATQSSNNTALGALALTNLNTGGANTAIGNLAGRFISGGVTTLTSLSNSILLGYSAFPLANGDTNEIVIGFGSVGAGSNTTTIGNTSTTSALIYGALSVSNITNTGTQSGFVPNKLTNAQRVAISSPVVGSIVYQTDTVGGSTEGLYIYKSTGWIQII